MSTRPQPVVFDPLVKPKPWGGRALADLFNKHLPPDAPIGETWELADLPGQQTRVASGPLAGRTLPDLRALWGDGLLADAQPIDGRFPLLIKFLDARETLSVQVHPKPDGGGAEHEVKHEAWYVVHAEPDAKIYVGFEPGVEPGDVRTAAREPEVATLLRPRTVAVGDCLYLPSGTPHALGGGIVVAEVQTPSDTTYRLYDWDRLGLDGKPRQLHIEEALANLRYDIPERLIVQPRRAITDPFADGERLVACERFAIDSFAVPERSETPISVAGFAVWIVLAGDGVLSNTEFECSFKSGDVVLIPADCRSMRMSVPSACRILHVTVPATSAETES